MPNPRVWGATVQEQAAEYPCDGLQDGAAWFRAVDVDAPPAATFRWLCQMRAAPYSYDLLDNWGRRSPRELTPGLGELEAGQRFMTIFDLHSFAPDDHLTLVLRRARGAFGEVALTYRVLPRGAGSRIVVKMLVSRDNALFAVGDLVMMRKQLLTLGRLAAARPG